MSGHAKTGSAAARRSKRWVALLLGALAASVLGAAAFWIHSRAVHSQVEAAPAAALELMHLETFVINLSDDDHTFLRIGIDLGVVPHSDAEEKMKSADTSVARDTILSLLSSSTSAELAAPAGRQRLKANLLTSLNERLPRLGVREIYITEFLIQR